MKKIFLYLGGLINQIEQGSIWLNDFSRAERNMWNEIGTFRSKFSWKIRTDQDLKWDENCFILFHFLNWYEMFRPFRAKRNRIDNFDINNCKLVPEKKTRYGTWKVESVREEETVNGSQERGVRSSRFLFFPLSREGVFLFFLILGFLLDFKLNRYCYW
jgi:hypothetical protein